MLYSVENEKRPRMRQALLKVAGLGFAAAAVVACPTVTLAGTHASPHDSTLSLPIPGTFFLMAIGLVVLIWVHWKMRKGG